MRELLRDRVGFNVAVLGGNAPSSLLPSVLAQPPKAPCTLVSRSVRPARSSAHVQEEAAGKLLASSVMDWLPQYSASLALNSLPHTDTKGKRVNVQARVHCNTMAFFASSTCAQWYPFSRCCTLSCLGMRDWVAQGPPTDTVPGSWAEFL